MVISLNVKKNSLWYKKNRYYQYTALNLFILILIAQNNHIINPQLLMRLVIFITIISCLFLLREDIAAQSSKTIHQTFTLEDATKVNIDVVGSQIEMRETKGSRVLVETTVTLSVANDRLLDFVANSGRYDLVKTIDEGLGEMTIESQKTQSVIMVKGEECQEELRYVFYIPTAVKYANNSTIEKIVNGE